MTNVASRPDQTSKPDGSDRRASRRRHLDRLLRPSTIAMVGLSDHSRMLKNVAPTFTSDAEIFVVNPRYASVAGCTTVKSLTDLDRPIDAVMSFMSAERTTELVEEAAGLDVGGVVLVAGGFGEFSDEGRALQARLKSAADSADMAVIGPNGIGLINVRKRISLTLAPEYNRRPGGISIVSHSGAALTAAGMAAWLYPDAGLNIQVSAGNEAVTSLADYVDYLAEEPDTTAIGLIMETIRDPEGFFTGVRRAADAGKPVVALKLARNQRSQQMAASHTGALTRDAWVYDLALRQAGVAVADDIEDLIDRLALFDQVPRRRWTAVSSLGVVAATGGMASLALDVAFAEGLTVPPLEHYQDWLSSRVAGVTVANPLDAPSFLAPQTWPEIIEKYVSDPDLDAIFVVHPTSDADLGPGERDSNAMVDAYARAAEQVDKPCIIANLSAVPDDWIRDHLGGGLVRGRGVAPSLRGLATMGAFVRHCRTKRKLPAAVPPLARPGVQIVKGSEERMLPFAATMELLVNAGIPIAPYFSVGPNDEPSGVSPPFAGPYALKLADVAHRTEHDAVRLQVDPEHVAEAIVDLRSIARRDGLPLAVAVQPMLETFGETILGIRGDSELGPLVVFGLGGIFVEVLGRVNGRLAPFDLDMARELIEEFRDVKVMHGFRGRPAWDLEALADILVAAGRLAAGAASWLGTLDINPLIYGPDGFQAVDALLMMRD
jgi:acetate---CoA ligase (ADP-forming)